MHVVINKQELKGNVPFCTRSWLKDIEFVHHEFDAIRSMLMDFAKKFGDTVLDVQLDKITKVWKEGFIIKKVCITADTTDGQKTFKFGVLGTGSWLKSIQNAKESQ